jgi:hypothetical protein
VTYIVAIFIVLGHTSAKQVSFVWFAAPIPVFVFLAFYALFLSLSIDRTASCKDLEEDLAVKAGTEPDKVGMAISSRVMDIKQAFPLSKAPLLAAYVPIVLGSLSVIIYLLVQAFHHDTNGWVQFIFMVINVLLLILVALGWLRIIAPGWFEKLDKVAEKKLKKVVGRLKKDHAGHHDAVQP